MLLRKRKNVVVIALILLSSLMTATLFQNCSGGIQSQADLSSLSGGNNSSSSTPDPVPAPAPLPTPVSMGCQTAQPADEETKTASCTAPKVGTGIFSIFKYTCIGNVWVRSATPVISDRCTDPTAVPLSNNDILKLCRPFVQTTQVATVTTALSSFNMKSGLGDGTMNNIGLDDAVSEISNSVVDPKISAGSQNLSTITIDGQPRDQATYSCKFLTNVSCSVLTDGSSTVTKAINMDPNSSNYGKDEVAIANAITDPTQRAAALNKILNGVLALGNGNLDRNNNENSCTFQLANGKTQQPFFMTHNKRASGYRCVQATLKVKVSARAFVDVETNDAYRTKAPSAAGDYQYLNVAINDNCWAESNLNPTPVALGNTANYGTAVAASDKWLVSLSPNEDQKDASGNVIKAVVGSITIFNRATLSSQKLFLPNIVGGGSTGDSTVAASLAGDMLVLSRVNRTTGKGYVSFYSYGAGGWAQRGAEFTQPNGQDKQRFGHALALSTSGILAVGAPYYAQNGAVTAALGDLSGRTFIYSCNTSTGCSYSGEIQNTTNTGSLFGAALSISGNRVAIGAPYLAGLTDWQGEGYVSVYDVSVGPFSAVGVKNVNAPGTANPGGYGRAFGYSLAVNGNKLIVGAPNKAVAGTTVSEKVGEAYYYSNFTSSAPVTVKGTTQGNLLGQGVGLNNKGAFVGCPYCQGGGTVSFHQYDGSGNITVAPTRNIFSLNRTTPDGFGNSIFATDIDLIVGASNRSVNSVAGAGAAYRYLVP